MSHELGELFESIIGKDNPSSLADVELESVEILNMSPKITQVPLFEHYA